MESRIGWFIGVFMMIICISFFAQGLCAGSFVKSKVTQTITLEDGRTAQVENIYLNTPEQILTNLSLYWFAILVIAFVFSGLIYFLYGDQ